MGQHHEQIRDQQKESWNKFSPGWKKWDTLAMEFMKPTGDEIIRFLKPKGHDLILDVASGTGEPGLSIATKLTSGKVMMTDLAEGMLEVARENAAKRGITNIETKVCDVGALPFADNTFDAISCRFGFMFFPDMLVAAKEMVRVVKPGGRIATSVWNIPEKNFWITATMNSINKHMQLQSPSNGEPGIFRCAKTGLIQNLFKQAGLNNCSENEVTGQLNCGTADVYWNFMTEVAAPVVAALSSADNEMRAKIQKEVYQIVNNTYPDGDVLIESSAQVIYGEK